MTALVTIGEFATLTHLSVRMLRRYHDAGLLEPDHVDPHSGYRYYSTAQIADAQIVRRFRDLDVPVKAIVRMLRTPDADERSALLTGHLVRLEDRLATTRAAVGALRRLLDPDAAPIDVVRRRDPARRVATLGPDVAHDTVEDWYSAAMAELDAAIAAAGAQAVGPPGGEYATALFTGGSGRATVHVPVDRDVTRGDVRTLVLPPRDLAVAVHRGPHDVVDVTYGRLGAHLADNAVVLGDTVVETYTVGPRDTDDPAAWRTEIGRPVFATTTAPTTSAADLV